MGDGSTKKRMTDEEHATRRSDIAAQRRLAGAALDQLAGDLDALHGTSFGRRGWRMLLYRGVSNFIDALTPALMETIEAGWGRARWRVTGAAIISGTHILE